MESTFTTDSGLKFVAPELTMYTTSLGSSSLTSDVMSPTVDVYNLALLVIWVCYSRHRTHRQMNAELSFTDVLHTICYN